MSTAPLDECDAAPLPDFRRSSRFCLIGSGLAFVALGALIFVLLNMATMPSHLVIGAAMMAGALLLLCSAFAIDDDDAVRQWWLSGLFYLLAGLAILLVPVIGASALTLALAVTLAISGIGRLVIGVREETQWVLLSGACSILVGTVIGFDWPQNSIWMISALVASDMLVQGIALVMTGIVHRFAVIGEDDD